MSRGSIAHSLIKTIIDVAEKQGADRPVLLACIGLNEETLQDNLLRVSIGKVKVLFEEIIRQTGDQAIGLHVAENVRPGSLGTLGYAMMSCASVHEAYVLLKSFGEVVADCAGFNFVKDEKVGTAIFTVSTNDLESVRPLNDMFMAIFWVFGQWITSVDIKLTTVSFTHSPTNYMGEYERIFGAQPAFSNEQCGLVIDRAYLDAPMDQPDAEINSIMLQKTEHTHRSLKSKEGLDKVVASQVRKFLPLQKATLTLIAASLNMSERSLSRKLKEEGFSYKTILASERRAMALDYLKDFNCSVINFYSQLGYRDYSAFSHAFRVWTGFSPTEYRDTLEKRQAR